MLDRSFGTDKKKTSTLQRSKETMKIQTRRYKRKVKREKKVREKYYEKCKYVFNIEF